MNGELFSGHAPCSLRLFFRCFSTNPPPPKRTGGGETHGGGGRKRGSGGKGKRGRGVGGGGVEKRGREVSRLQFLACSRTFATKRVGQKIPEGWRRNARLLELTIPSDVAPAMGVENSIVRGLGHGCTR